jgi:hypothetical protein
MIRAIVELLKLLVRLAELESVSKSTDTAADSELNGISVVESPRTAARMELPIEQKGHTSPFSLPAPATQTTAVSPVPKKRGRPPKLNRTEDLRTDPSYPSAQKPYQ